MQIKPVTINNFWNQLLLNISAAQNLQVFPTGSSFLKFFFTNLLNVLHIDSISRRSALPADGAHERFVVAVQSLVPR